MLAGHAHRQGYTVRGGRVWDILAAVRRFGYHGGVAAVDEAVEALCEADLLVLDDLDAPYAGPRLVDQAYADAVLDRPRWWRPVASYGSADLMRLAMVLHHRARHALRTVVVSRGDARASARDLLKIDRSDLARALLGIAGEVLDDREPDVEAMQSRYGARANMSRR